MMYLIGTPHCDNAVIKHILYICEMMISGKFGGYVDPVEGNI